MLDAILTPLITSPNLPHYLEQLQEFFAQETDRRKAFHRSVNEGDKVEFINGAIVTHLPIRLKDHLVGNRLLVITAILNLGLTLASATLFTLNCHAERSEASLRPRIFQVNGMLRRTSA